MRWWWRRRMGWQLYDKGAQCHVSKVFVIDQNTSWANVICTHTQPPLPRPTHLCCRSGNTIRTSINLYVFHTFAFVMPRIGDFTGCWGSCEKSGSLGKHKPPPKTDHIKQMDRGGCNRQMAISLWTLVNSRGRSTDVQMAARQRRQCKNTENDSFTEHQHQWPMLTVCTTVIFGGGGWGGGAIVYFACVMYRFSYICIDCMW